MALAHVHVTVMLPSDIFLASNSRKVVNSKVTHVPSMNPSTQRQEKNGMYLARVLTCQTNPTLTSRTRNFARNSLPINMVRTLNCALKNKQEEELATPVVQLTNQWSAERG